MHNQYVNYVRRSAREGTSVPIGDMAAVLPVSSNAMPSLELRDLQIAMSKLPDEQRGAILLVGLEGMSYEEVASILQIPLGTVRSRISRGRDQLRRLMGLEEEPAPQDAARRYPRAA
jgi:RNA polymerase sigma-70 factor (ECF subfamily)